MATVNKDFRVKNGLVVEGTTATVNGNDILTIVSNQINPENGVLYLGTGASIDTEQGNASITLDGANVLTTASNTGNLPEGANLYFTDARAISALNGATIGSLTLDNIYSPQDLLVIGGDVQVGGGLTVGGEAVLTTSDIIANTDGLSEGTSNLYFTDARAIAAVENATFTSLSAGSIATDYITTGNGQLQIDSGVIISSFQGNAYIDVDGQTLATQTYVNTAVSNLVDSAPGALDTLNELAAALGDDANFSTTVTTAIGEKVAKAGDTMTGYLTLHANPESNLHAATKQYVDGAITTAVDAIDTDDIEEGSGNLYYTNARVASLLRNANLTNIQITGDGVAEVLTITAENGVADSDTDDLAEGSTNLYFTDARAIAALDNETITPVAVEGVSHVDYEENSTILRTRSSHQNIDPSNNSAAIAVFQTSEFSGIKAVIKITDPTTGNKEILEALVLFDASGNGHVTEYGNVFTSTQLSDGVATTFAEGQAIVYIDTSISSGTVDAFVTMIP